MLPVAAAASPRTGVAAYRLDPVRCRPQDLDGVGAQEPVLTAAFGDRRAHSLAGEGMPHEDDPPLVARHAESPVGDRTDLDLDQLAHERGAADDRAARTGIPVPSAP